MGQRAIGSSLIRKYGFVYRYRYGIGCHRSVCRTKPQRNILYCSYYLIRNTYTWMSYCLLDINLLLRLSMLIIV